MSNTFHGGNSVKASTLVVGDTIRHPRMQNIILVIESTGSQIYARGYEQANTKDHIFISPDSIVIKVTNASTDTTLDGVA